MKEIKKRLKQIILGLIVLFVLGIGTYLTINLIMIYEANKYIIDIEDEMNVDAIMVLGAFVYTDGRLSTMLEDRMIIGLDAYDNGMSDRLLLSGDHGQTNYDEVNSMKSYAEEEGVPTEQIFMDHAGFSTYESMYRAKEIFDVDSIIIITQDYHLKRAIYIARQMGLEAYGIPSDRYIYPKMPYYKFRESLARIKDFTYVNILKPEPTYLGDVIPISGDGKATHD